MMSCEPLRRVTLHWQSRVAWCSLKTNPYGLRLLMTLSAWGPYPASPDQDESQPISTTRREE